MKTSENKSRREFLTSGGSVLSASFIAINMPLILSACERAQENLQAVADYQNITAELAAELSAIADQIIPEDETPGATGMGAVYFMDAVFGGFMAGALPMVEQGIADLQQKVQLLDANVERFSQLSFDQQTTVLKSEEATPLFGTLRFLTLCGVFALPEHGGNRDQGGWQLIGFDHQHVWQPPFGYYDANSHGESQGTGGEHGHA